MTSCKLVFRNLRKNLRDYLIYFLTLTLAVSLFYAFNSLSDQPAFAEMSMTRRLLYDQLSGLMAALSVVVAIVLGFLIVYANQFLRKRRKKELGLYQLLGMKRGRISRVFAGETFCVGVLSLAAGLVLGVALSQGVSLIALRLFAVALENYRFVLSWPALRQTVLCFAVIFLLVMAFNAVSVAHMRLIDLLTAGRQNESLGPERPVISALAFALALLCIGLGWGLFARNGLLPVKGNPSFQIAGAALVVGTVLLFYAVASVFLRAMQADSRFYLHGLNAFLVRQIGSKIRTNYMILSVICGLLTVTICAVSIGASTALTMNELAQAATPYDLNVTSDVERDGDGDIAAYLTANSVPIDAYAETMTQISIYASDLTYADLFAGQTLQLWPIDASLPETPVSIVSLSDFNRALALQGRAPVTLGEDSYLLNGNYKGTYRYLAEALHTRPVLTVSGVTLTAGAETPLQETYFMNQIGNNDRGTLIVPDAVAAKLTKAVNILLVRYKPDTSPDAVLQSMLPIGLDDAHGYRYAEKTMMYDMFYGINALVTFLCCYVGIVFLLICAALLALKQLTETSDNVYRYSLLQKLGAQPLQIDRTLFAQIAVFFAAPLAVAGVYSLLFVQKGTEVVETFMNLHISTNLVCTAVLFLLIYGGYFLATYLACRRMVADHTGQAQTRG